MKNADESLISRSDCAGWLLSCFLSTDCWPEGPSDQLNPCKSACFHPDVSCCLTDRSPGTPGPVRGPPAGWLHSSSSSFHVCSCAILKISNKCHIFPERTCLSSFFSVWVKLVLSKYKMGTSGFHPAASQPPTKTHSEGQHPQK